MGREYIGLPVFLKGLFSENVRRIEVGWGAVEGVIPPQGKIGIHGTVSGHAFGGGSFFGYQLLE